MKYRFLIFLIGLIVTATAQKNLPGTQLVIKKTAADLNIDGVLDEQPGRKQPYLLIFS